MPLQISHQLVWLIRRWGMAAHESHDQASWQGAQEGGKVVCMHAYSFMLYTSLLFFWLWYLKVESHELLLLYLSRQPKAPLSSLELPSSTPFPPFHLISVMGDAREKVSVHWTMTSIISTFSSFLDPNFLNNFFNTSQTVKLKQTSD